MFDIGILYDTIKDLKKSTTRFRTNCFFDNYKLVTLSKRNDAKLCVGKESVCIIFKESNFIRLYYWISGINAIEEIYSCLIHDCDKKRAVFIELVGFDKEINDIQKRFIKYGVMHYATLNRWRTSSIRNLNTKNNSIMCAAIDKSDIEKVHSIFEESFDPCISHLPTEEQLCQLQNKQLIYGAYLNQKLTGAFCLEDIGIRGKYGRCVAVDRRYHGMGIGKKILNYGYSQHPECSNYVAWIGEDNMISQKVHKNLGFRKDGLKTIALKYDRREE